MQDWRDYLTAVATRYKGRAHYFQVWNEPNQPDFYQGSMETLVAMTRIAYEVIKGVQLIQHGAESSAERARRIQMAGQLSGPGRQTLL